MSAFESDGAFFPTSEWRTTRSIKQARLSPETNFVIIEWDADVDDQDRRSKKEEGAEECFGSKSSSSSSYPCIWLRDFCHCDVCFDEPTAMRKTNLHDITTDITAAEVSLGQAGKQLRVRWSDNHESAYPANWLWCNRFNATAPDPFNDFPREFWRADSIRNRLREFEFDELMTSDATLCDWIIQLKVLGISLIKNAPQKLEALATFGKRVGYLKETVLGRVSDLYAPPSRLKPDYTTGDLYLHTDCSFLHQHPNVQLLHCIEQFAGEGGENVLVDGFHVANKLRKLDHQAFAALSTYKVDFYNRGDRARGKYFNIASNTILRLNADGEVDRVVFGNHSRSPVMRMPPEKVALFYKAMRLFEEHLYGKENVFTYKMKPGDVLSFDNGRVLHSRKGFELTDGAVRHVALGYLDWEMLENKMRVMSVYKECPNGHSVI